MDLLTDAEAQVQRAKRTTLPEAALAQRQAAEKTWGYVASETNRVLRRAGYAITPGDHAHRDRATHLRRLDEALGCDLRPRHEAFAEVHGDCFYDGRCPPPDRLDAMVAEARRFVEDVKDAVEEVKRRGRARP